MLYLGWPEKKDEKERAQRAVLSMAHDLSFQSFLDLVVAPSRHKTMLEMCDLSPNDPELPRRQGAVRLMTDLLAISKDAQLGLGAR